MGSRELCACVSWPMREPTGSNTDRMGREVRSELEFKNLADISLRLTPCKVIIVTAWLKAKEGKLRA